MRNYIFTVYTLHDAKSISEINFIRGKFILFPKNRFNLSNHYICSEPLDEPSYKKLSDFSFKDADL